MVHTVRCPTGTRFDSPCNRYVREVYDSLRRRGLLIQVERKNDAGSALYYCRSANELIEQSGYMWIARICESGKEIEVWEDEFELDD